MERTMKVCKTCGVEKPLDEFYRESKLRWKPDCKPCYDTKRKQWKVFGGPRDRSGVGQQTSERYAENPGKHRRQNSSYKARNPDKIRARLIVAMRVYRGTLKRPTSCERCGVECKPDAHHTDYTKPLYVDWLCKSCHRAADIELQRRSA
jgi:hypothetical protein